MFKYLPIELPFALLRVQSHNSYGLNAIANHKNSSLFNWNLFDNQDLISHTVSVFRETVICGHLCITHSKAAPMSRASRAAYSPHLNRLSRFPKVSSAHSVTMRKMHLYRHSTNGSISIASPFARIQNPGHSNLSCYL